MSAKRYTEEFRFEVVKQATDWGHPVAEVANRREQLATACINGLGATEYRRLNSWSRSTRMRS